MKNNDVCIVFLAYNEEDTIKKTVENAFNFFSKTNYDWSILVVDDGSTDKTGIILDELADKNPRVEIFHHRENRGYAMATKTALDLAEGDIIFTIDGDGQHMPEDIPKFINKIEEGYDIVVGWKKKRRDPKYRIMLSRGYNLLTRLLFNLNLHDVDCGFRAFTREAAKRTDIEYRNVPVGPEILVKAKKRGLKITELPVEHYPRATGESIFRSWRMPALIYRIFLSLIKLRLSA